MLYPRFNKMPQDFQQTNAMVKEDESGYGTEVVEVSRRRMLAGKGC